MEEGVGDGEVSPSSSSETGVRVGRSAPGTWRVVDTGVATGRVGSLAEMGAFVPELAAVVAAEAVDSGRPIARARWERTASTVAAAIALTVAFGTWLFGGARELRSLPPPVFGVPAFWSELEERR